MAVTHHPLPAERAVFWYGCNLLRHGDILRLTARFLEAVGVDAAPRGGPSHCCGSTTEHNARITFLLYPSDAADHLPRAVVCASRIRH